MQKYNAFKFIIHNYFFYMVSYFLKYVYDRANGKNSFTFYYMTVHYRYLLQKNILLLRCREIIIIFE